MIRFVFAFADDFSVDIVMESKGEVPSDGALQSC
jgi:hypothetical protein